MRAILLLLISTGLGLSADAARAQSYPYKPIRLIVGFAPGGNVDITARLLGRKLTENLGQAIIVDNREGAGGIIAANLVAKAAVDGYTLLMAPASHAMQPALYRTMPYDTVNDFAPVSTVATAPHFLVVNTALSVNTVKELIALAKSKPGWLNYGSAGVGSATHLEGELFRTMAGIDIVHIAYKGVGPAVNALASGQVQIVFTGTVAALPFIRLGKLKAVGVTSAKRLSTAPNVPTFVESGLPQFIVESPVGVLAPAGTPKAVINRLNMEIVRFTQLAEIHDAMIAQGAEQAASTPQEYKARIAEEVVRWRKVVKDAGIPLQ